MRCGRRAETHQDQGSRGKRALSAQPGRSGHPVHRFPPPDGRPVGGHLPKPESKHGEAAGQVRPGGIARDSGLDSAQMSTSGKRRREGVQSKEAEETASRGSAQASTFQGRRLRKGQHRDPGARLRVDRRHWARPCSRTSTWKCPGSGQDAATHFNQEVSVCMHVGCVLCTCTHTDVCCVCTYVDAPACARRRGLGRAGNVASVNSQQSVVQGCVSEHSTRLPSFLCV